MLRLHANTLRPNMYWKNWLNWWAHSELYYKKHDIWPWHKPNHVIQLNCSEVHTHASYKTTRTWDNFNSQGTKIHYELLKMNYLSDELWLIANNSKRFANGANSIISNNLGFRKCFVIYQNWNIDLTRKDISK